MIEHVWNRWNSLKLWQLGVFGFSLAWWLLLAPAALRHLWLRVMGKALPPILNDLLVIFYLLVALGAIVSLLDLNDKKPSRSRVVAVYFVLGLLSAGLLGMLGWNPKWL